jgi:hydrogenase expression/formation protein HypC
MCLAVPGKILSVEGEDPLLRAGRVDFSGIVKSVNLAYVPEAGVGDYVIVHVGFAISKLDEAEALQVLDYLRQIGEFDPTGGELAPPPAESLFPSETPRPRAGESAPGASRSP